MQRVSTIWLRLQSTMLIYFYFWLGFVQNNFRKCGYCSPSPLALELTQLRAPRSELMGGSPSFDCSAVPHDAFRHVQVSSSLIFRLEVEAVKNTSKVASSQSRYQEFFILMSRPDEHIMKCSKGAYPPPCHKDPLSRMFLAAQKSISVKKQWHLDF